MIAYPTFTAKIKRGRLTPIRSLFVPIMTQLQTLGALSLSPFDLLNLWLHGKSLHTQKSYRRDFTIFLTFIGDRPITAVTLLEIQNYVNFLGSQGYQPSTINRKLAAVKSFYSFFNQANLFNSNPTNLITLKTIKNTLSERILSESQVLKLIDSANSYRDQCLLKLLYATGGRVAEIVGLTWRDLKDKGHCGQITLFGKGSKTRTVIISKNVLDEILQLKQGGLDSPVFKSRKGTKAITTTQALRIVKAAAKKAGIEGNVSPHWLRHSHASHSLERGASIKLVQESMGHSSIAITERYLHSNPADGSGLYLVF
jgi:integrase/recombinase XerD